jgi:hypothetical protein
MNPKPTGPPDNFLPRNFAGRFLLGVRSSPFVPFSAVFLYALTLGRRRGLNWSEWLVRIAMWEFFRTLLAVSICGLIWAVAAPAWLPAFAFRYARRLGVLAMVPFLILAALLIWSN